MSIYYFTEKGINKLKEQIIELEQRLRNLQIQSAYLAEVGGDQYHDNASYEQLVIDLRGVDKRLNDAHQVYNHAKIIRLPKTTDRVIIGCEVSIFARGEEQTWRIVGYGESDPEKHFIAYNSPFAKLMIGKREGDVIEEEMAGKIVQIEILKIMIPNNNKEDYNGR